MCMPETKMSAQGTQLVNANPSSNSVCPFFGDSISKLLLVKVVVSY